MTEQGERTFDARAAFDQIEAQRAEIGYSQSELTRAADINEGTYVALKRDTRRVPHQRTVRKLRNALELLRFRAGATG